MPRVEALKALLLHLPTLAPIMANTWLAKYTPLAAPNSTSGYGIIHACEGVYHGECLSTAVSCTFLRMVLDTFIANAEKAIAIMAYVDDVVLIFDQELFPTVWPTYVSTLQQFNLLVEKSKCNAWISDDSTPTVAIQEALGTDGITIVTGGLPGHCGSR